MRVLESLASLINDVIRQPVIAAEISSARLAPLNKVGREVGRPQNVRPIAINGPLWKILEACILTRLEDYVHTHGVISKDQIGFMRGCEMNLMKFREMSSKLKSLPKVTERYILFVDLKNASNRVVHERLFFELKNKGIEGRLLSTVRKLYSSSLMRLDLHSDPIFVNRGCLQGSSISPLFFNCYIDDFVRDLGADSFSTTLAYADDLCVMCTYLKQLIRVLSVIGQWSARMGIEVNKAKSGIFVINRKRYEVKEISGIPIVAKYSYLAKEMIDRMVENLLQEE